MSVLDAVLSAPPAERTGGLSAFLHERSWIQALAWWLQKAGVIRPTRRDVVGLLVRDIARLDELLNEQVNAILHLRAFQKFEASWRGLKYLVDQGDESDGVKIRMMHLTWRELVRDQERALEFDQSQLFRKVYGEEFGTPGGEPYGMLLGDYEVSHRIGPAHPTDDMAALGGIAGVAAAAFAPFIVAADPSLLGLEGFSELERSLNLQQIFSAVEYTKWNSLRQAEDARFVGVVLPRVLARTPYDEHRGRADAFRFHEDVSGPDQSKYLWGTAVYAFGAIAIRAFAESGWFADLRGAGIDGRGQGLAPNLPVHYFATDRRGIAAKCSTDVAITEPREKELSEFGFIALCHCPDTELSAFFGNMSLQRPAQYDRDAGSINARMSAMIQYILCVGRFAHCLKVMARDRVGAATDAAAVEEQLQRWIMNYTTASSDLDELVRARYPLREARVQVREAPGKPGSYQCVMHLCPHAQLDQVLAAVRLSTELNPARR
jgi:type VI secretion system ImpC/EvpB family protein